ncbi:AAA family ATPase [Thermoproteota archaeon]
MIVCVTGTIASGKGKGADVIRKLGFEHHSFSLEIRAIARERDIEINRDNLSALGRKLREEKPSGSIIGDRVLEKIKKHPDKDYVLDGMRDVGEVEVLKNYEKETGTRIIIIAVNAPQELRWERLKTRKRHGDPETFEAFKEIDDREFEGGHGQDVGDVMKMADYVVDNSGNLEDFEANMKKIIEKEK